MERPLNENHDDAFSIAIEPQRKFVHIVMRGFWSREDFERFDARLRAMLPQLPAGGCAIGDQVTLFDLTGFQVQNQGILAGLAGMAADPSIGSRRIAIVLTAALLKMQARRVAPGYGLFDTQAAAIAWLLEPIKTI